jgi:hypothetical protein
MLVLVAVLVRLQTSGFRLQAPSTKNQERLFALNFQLSVLSFCPNIFLPFAFTPSCPGSRLGTHCPQAPACRGPLPAFTVPYLGIALRASGNSWGPATGGFSTAVLPWAQPTTESLGSSISGVVCVTLFLTGMRPVRIMCGKSLTRKRCLKHQIAMNFRRCENFFARFISFWIRHCLSRVSSFVRWAPSMRPRPHFFLGTALPKRVADGIVEESRRSTDRWIF